MFFVVFSIFALSDAIWISEEYWTTVNNDGSLLGDRTIKDFFTFHTAHFNVPMRKAFIAFWITHDELGQYETFGHAYLVQNGVCARFVDRYQKAKTICGGFRVLSRSNNEGNLAFKFVQAGQVNIDEAVEYHDKQVAKIISWTKNEVWYGSAYMKEAFAEGIDFESEYVKISYVDDPFSYQQNVYILIRCNKDDPEAGKSQYHSFYHDSEEKHQLRIPSKWLWFNQKGLKILRHIQQLREQQIKHEKKRKNEEQLRYQQRQYEQRYTTAERPCSIDDEPDEKWKFYGGSDSYFL